MKPFSPFILASLLTAALTLAAAIGLNIAIDPYGLYGTPALSGLSQRKPRAYTHEGAAKLARFRRSHATLVVVGNSRIDIGFDPQAEVWPAEVRRVFNFGLPGAAFGDQMAYARHAIARHNARSVLVGLDFFDFLAARNDSSTAPLPAPLQTDWRQRLSAFAATTLSLDAVGDSVVTWLSQSDPDSEDMTALGFNPLRQYRKIVRKEGHFALAHQKNNEYVRRLIKYPKTVRRADGRESAAFSQLRNFLALSREKGVQVRLFIYPYHADLLESLRLAGLWPAFEDWKRLVTEVATAMEGPGWPLELWDFSGYHGYATEPIPQAGDTRHDMRWYWEPGHFKPALGTRMIEVLYGRRRAEGSFGVRLTPQSLDAQLARIRLERQTYQRERGEDIARIETLFHTLAVPARSG